MYTHTYGLRTVTSRARTGNQIDSDLNVRLKVSVRMNFFWVRGY